ncbi:MAG TPA: hypothetical protein VHD55_01820 [Candidatus Paceibacterota bacterium]|nr:hypothetical protein [Candidatus Paceibacterota bacterium]
MEVQGDADTALKVVMRKPADMHQHVRTGATLELVAPMVRARFATFVAMPNTQPDYITTSDALVAYHSEIVGAMFPEWSARGYKPGKDPDRVPDCLMTLYFTDALEPKEIEHSLPYPFAGVKYYPRGLTTNSDKGIADPASLWTPGTKAYEVVRMLADSDKVLLMHGADGLDKDRHELDPFEQEPHFFRETLPRTMDAHPDAKISVEHLSTAVGAEFIRNHGSERLGCSLTPHHLLLDRRDVLRGGFNPHRYWLPPIQSSEHKEELRRLAAEDHPFVWLGSDSAPHTVDKKQAACCAGGVLTAHAGIELYVEAFEDMGALDDRFERFASVNGPRFYGYEPSGEKITLIREEWKFNNFFCLSTDVSQRLNPEQNIRPFRLGEPIRWKLAV